MSKRLSKSNSSAHTNQTKVGIALFVKVSWTPTNGGRVDFVNRYSTLPRIIVFFPSRLRVADKVSPKIYLEWAFVRHPVPVVPTRLVWLLV